MAEADETLEKRRRYDRAYRLKNAERIREYKRDWNSRYPERHRKHSRDAEARKKKAQRQRSAQRERSRRWAERNPEKVRENSRRWRELNRERIREQNRTWIKNNPERAREINRRSSEKRRGPARIAYEKQYRRDNPEKVAQIRRNWQKANREQVNEYNREWKQREKRRVELGLPRAPRHRTTKNEKLDNARAADRFFNRRVLVHQKKTLLDEAEGVSHAARWQATVEGILERRQSRQALTGFLAHRVITELVDKRVEELRRSSRAEDLRMDLIAIRARGGSAPDLDTALRRLATTDVVTQVEKKLRIPIFIPRPARAKQNVDKPRTDTGPATASISPSQPRLPLS